MTRVFRYRTNVLEIPIVILDKDLGPIPSYARPGDAAVDLVARTDAELSPCGGRTLIPTGVAIALPNGYAGLVLSRSGLAARHGVCCLNAPGLIDSGFRGEIQVVLLNTDPKESYIVHRGDRIAQLMVVLADRVSFHGVDQLDLSERGENGFGHTGR